MSPWSNLTPSEFEEFCYHLLEYNNFANLSWYGEGGGDKGRDILCTKVERPIDGKESQCSWVVQCKHYQKAKVSKQMLQEWLAACREHDPDRVLLVVSGTLSANLKDWLKSVRKDYRFSIHTWEEVDIRREYSKHGEKLRQHFPKLPAIRGPVHLSPLGPVYETFTCDEMDECGIFCMNALDEKDALRKVREFVDFLKANDVDISK